MAVLYRKYRPQTFSEVVSQKYIIKTLQNQVAAGKPAHAYLFTGSRGVGKTSIARIFAKAINCQKAKKGEPCGECNVCKQIEQGNFLDLVEIDAASNTGVDNIRDLIEHVKFSPSVGAYKVFIIDEVHMLSKGAFNALLKTLEEPPAHAVFILATTEINKVPATIISRTQRFDFKALSVEDLEKHLAEIVKKEKLKLPAQVLSLVAEHADGSVRDSLSLLGKVLTLGDDASLEECQQLLGITDASVSQGLLEMLLAGNSPAIPAFFESMADRGADMLAFNRDFLEFLRGALVYKITQGKSAAGLSENQQKFFAQALAQATLSDLIFITRLFLRSFKEISGSPSPDIPLLLAALEAAAKKQAPAAVSGGGMIKAEKHVLPQEKMPHAAAKPAESPVLESKTVKPAVSATEPAEPVIEAYEDSDVTLEELQSVWPHVIHKLREVNSPLANLVKCSPLQRVERGRAVLGVKYAFHKQNIEQQKNISLIGGIVKDLLKKGVGVAAEVVKEERVDVKPTEEALSDALAILGGELVE